MGPVKRKQGLPKHLPRHLPGQILIAVLITAISLSSIAQTDLVHLPELGNSASEVLSSAEEREYAASLVRQMRAYELLVEDPLINGFFSNMGYNLVSSSDKPGATFTFVILDQSVINAFAAPGGIVALHSGLILLAETQDEVAGVLSHEIAHVTQLHMYRAFEKGKTMNILSMLVMMGLILAAQGNGEAITGAVMGAQAAAQQAQINFTRHNEIEADRIGIRTLVASGYDPQGMPDFFEKMGHSSRANGEGPPEFLRTHPVSVNRIAETKSELVKEKTEAQQNGLRYGLAIAFQKNAEYDKAESLLGNLLEKAPSNLAFQLQLANLNIKRGRQQQALDTLSELYQIFPGNKAIALEYGNALLFDNDPVQAETASVVLRQQLVSQKDDPTLYALYARAANLAGDEIRSTEAIAESYYQRGGVEEAISQLDGLLKQSDLDYYQRARVSARLTELRIEAGETDQSEREG